MFPGAEIQLSNSAESTEGISPSLAVAEDGATTGSLFFLPPKINFESKYNDA